MILYVLSFLYDPQHYWSLDGDASIVGRNLKGFQTLFDNAQRFISFEWLVCSVMVGWSWTVLAYCNRNASFAAWLCILRLQLAFSLMISPTKHRSTMNCIISWDLACILSAVMADKNTAAIFSSDLCRCNIYESSELNCMVALVLVS